MRATVVASFTNQVGSFGILYVGMFGMIVVFFSGLKSWVWYLRKKLKDLFWKISKNNPGILGAFLLE